MRLQCDGDCGLPLGLGIFVGAVAAAVGASVVAVLMLRRSANGARSGRRTGRRPPMRTPGGPRRGLRQVTRHGRTGPPTDGRRPDGRRRPRRPRRRHQVESTDVVTATTRRPKRYRRGAHHQPARRRDRRRGGHEPAGTSGIAWHVDPIDGTTNFLYGLPLWSTSVAAVDGEGGLVGAVYVPATGELFAAARGLGATRNERPIAATAETELALALVATGFGYDPSNGPGRQPASPRSRRRPRHPPHRLGRDRPLLRGGGLLDAYYEENLNWWDMAAGELIAGEAGCRGGDFEGGPVAPAQLLVARPGMFDLLQVCSPAQRAARPATEGAPTPVMSGMMCTWVHAS